MRIAGVVMIVACSSPSSSPTPSDKPAPVAAPAVRPPLPARPARATATTPDLQCDVLGPKEYIKITTDKTKLTGELIRKSGARAIPTRHILYRAVASDDAYDLVFDGYGAGDYVHSRGEPTWRPREQLTKGTSVIARIAGVNGTSRLFVDRDVDLVTGMVAPPEAGSYGCDDH